jgi:sucrose-6-phosphate hydrolase SacC (GH32 family)
VVIGWMSNWAYAADVPTAPWRGSMAIPRELALQRTPTGLVLGNHPAAPVERAVGGPEQALARVDVDGRRELAPLDREGAYWVGATLRPGDAATAAVQLFGRGGREGARVSYDRTAGELVVQRAGSGPAAFTDRFGTRYRVPVPLEDGRVRLDVLVDRGSVEVFAHGGRTSVTTLALPEAGTTGLALLSDGGASTFEDVSVRAFGS